MTNLQTTPAINASELRIGNWVNYTGREYSILKNGPILVESINDRGINIDLVTSFDTATNEVYDFRDLQPIPLTPEILEKAIENIGAGELRDTMADFIRENIKYVHQLQNLFYCLTGEELEINL